MAGYISIKTILDDCLDHPLLKEYGLTLERAVAYTVEFIRIIGMPNIFEEKTAIIELDNHRAKLPCDYHLMILVRLIKDKCGEHHLVAFRYTSDSFHMSNLESPSRDLTYKILGNVIFTSIKEGLIEIAYRAIPVDDEGYPLVLDNSPFIRALELYIKNKCFTVLFDLNKISLTVLSNTQLQYAFAVGLAQTDLVKPSVDEMQSITNAFNTLIPRVNEHSRGFITNGSMERIRLQ